MSRLQIAGVVLLLAALAALAYAPAQYLPFFADDYIQIQLSRDFGPDWKALAKDPLYRCRATSIFVTYWTEQAAGLTPLAFKLGSVFLHVLNTLVVAGLGFWPAIGWRRALLAAGFFAVAEGHQEAVIWYAALPELLVFFFCGLTALAFIASVRRGPLFYGLSLAAFVLALLSKESGVAAAGAVLLVCCVERLGIRRTILQLAPFALLSAVYLYGMFAASSDILHFHDGAFSISPTFLLTIVNSGVRMLWIWGLLALAALFVFDRLSFRTFVPASLAWIPMALFPYSFLAYMDRVPSRHTYLASVSLALLVAAALLALAQARGIRLAAGIAAIILIQNCAYLWTRKQEQYRVRAEPTEQLLRLVRQKPRELRIECFPYGFWVARSAIEIGAGAAWNERMWTPRGNCQPEKTVIVVGD